MTSNFELCLKLGKEFTEENATTYFAKLDNRIKSEGLSEITFQVANDFFLPDDEIGFTPYQLNKMYSGFNYKLKLPALQITTKSDFLQEKVNVLNLKSCMLKSFESA